MKKYYVGLIQLIISCIWSTGVLAQSLPTGQSLTLDYAAPVRYIIEDLRVTGNESIDAASILSHVGFKVGDMVELPGSSITHTIKKLCKQKMVDTIAIYAHRGRDDQHVILTLKVAERPRLADYTFAGINKQEQKQLVARVSLVTGQVVTDTLIDNVQKKIQAYWEEQGYSHAVVTIAAAPDSTHPKHVKLHIEIDKGVKQCVHTIQFEGNEHVASHVLKSQLQHLREKPRFTLFQDMLQRILPSKILRKNSVLWQPLSVSSLLLYLKEHIIFRPTYFTAARLQEAKQCILDYYRSQGFRDAVITVTTCEKGVEGDMQVTFNIREGQQYRVGAIKWVGNCLYSDQELHQILGVQQGDTYNPLLLRRKLGNGAEEPGIASLYADKGHLFFQVNPVEKGLKDNIVDLEIRIQEGPQVNIDQVLIEGNRVTHDYVIRRELRTLPGDVYSRANLQRSYRELAQLNIFDPAIDIVTIPNYTAKTATIKYTVKERPRFELKLSGGWAGGVVGEMTLATNNFSLGNLWQRQLPVGGRQTLSLVLEMVSNRQGYKNFIFQFTEPWLGGKKPIPFDLGLNYALEEHRKSLGAKVGIGAKLSWPDDYTTLRSSVAYYAHQYHAYDLFDSGEKNNGTLKELALKLSIERDSTDNPLYPKEGSKVALHTGITPPWSWYTAHDRSQAYLWKEYHQWMLDGACFLQIFNNLVFHVRGNFGILGKFSSQNHTAPFQRFYLGGVLRGPEKALIGKEYISLRGYEEDFIVPKDDTTGYRGGVVYDKFVLELRYPLVANHAVSAYALGFAEGGYTWSRLQDYNPFMMKRSAGVGIRLYLPMLVGTTIGFDLGYGFDKEPTDVDYNALKLQFSMGADTLR